MTDIHVLVLGDLHNTGPLTAELQGAGMRVTARALDERGAPGAVDVVVLLGSTPPDWLSAQEAMPAAPLIVVAPSADALERVRLLDLGADHVLHGAPTPAEVLAQVRASTRRREPTGPPCLVMDEGRREVIVSGRRVALTAVEWRLLAQLVASPGRTFSKAELMDRVWGSAIGAESMVSAQICRLRQKIKGDPDAPPLILTTWGVGYRYEPPVSDECP